MSGYEWRRLVTFADTNVVGNVYFARYLDWQGECREHFLAEHAPDTAKAVIAGSLTLVTASCSAEFYEECFAFDLLTVRMTLDALAAHRIEMTFVYLRNDRQVARGRQVAACMVRTDSGLSPTPVPSDLALAAEAFA
jgi:enediyne biosynthesis thioesterase